MNNKKIFYIEGRVQPFVAWDEHAVSPQVLEKSLFIKVIDYESYSDLLKECVILKRQAHTARLGLEEIRRVGDIEGMRPDNFASIARRWIKNMTEDLTDENIA